jgi:hypothetical protein
MVTPPTPTALRRTQRVVYLLTLTWGGRVYRLSTEPVTVEETDTGRALQFIGGLVEIPDVTDAADREGDGDGGASVPMAIFLDGTDIAERIAQGHRLDGARGELAELPIGWDGAVLDADEPATWSRRTVHVRGGQLLLPILAGADAPASSLSFTLEEIPSEGTRPLLEPESVIDDRSWSEAPELAGKVYPLVIGAPGVFRKSDGTLGSTSGSPAYPVEYTGANADTLLICGEWVAAATVTIYDGDGGSAVATVSNTRDGRNRPVAVVDIHGHGSLSKTSATYWAGWTNGSGILDPLSGQPLRTLGEVCVWALLRLGVAVDVGAWAAQQVGPLASVVVDTYLNDPEQTPLDLVMDLLSEIPTVSLRSGPQGIYPLVRLLDVDDGTAVATITEGGDFSPVGPLETQTEPSEIRSSWSVRFAPRANGGALKRTVTCTPERDPTDAEQFTTAYALMSASRHGRIDGQTVELPWLYDEASAALIAALNVRVRGFAYATRTYRADWRYGWLERGQRIRLSSASLHLADVLVEVVGKAPRIGGYLITLAFDDDPIRLGSRQAS